MEKEAVPFTAFTENFSSIPLMAPPPFGKEIEGVSIALDFVFPPSVLRNCEDEFWFSFSLFILLPFHFGCLYNGTVSPLRDRVRNDREAARVICGSERPQPNPKNPLRAPESYESESCGLNPDRPGLVAMGTLIKPVPVTGFAANFSPMPMIAPPSLGRVMAGEAEKDMRSCMT